MKKLITAILNNRAILAGLVAVYAVAGVIAFKHLPIEAYPDVTNTQVQVITLWPGHAAEEVEKFVTVPLENVLNSLPQRASLRSISQFGLSVVTIVFDDDANRLTSRNLVTQQVAQVTLPQGAQAALSPDSTPVGEIFRYTLQAPPDMPATEVRALEDWVVERQFRTVPGIVDVNGFGGPVKQYQALVDPVKLKSLGLTLKQVVDALGGSNKNAGGAYIERGEQMFIVRGIGLIKDLDDIRATVITAVKGTPVTVGDVAEIRIGNQLRLGRVGITKPGKNSSHEINDLDDVIQGIVLLRKGENALEVLKLVEAKAEEINKAYLPPGVRLVIHYDRTELIDRTLHTVQHNMIEGISLVLLVLIAFLGVRNVRSALIVAAVIPLALLGAFMLLDYQHIPANLISMGAIDFGIIVDSAVVIIENIIHRIETGHRKHHAVRHAILDGTVQMGKPLLFSKLVLLAAFLPLFTMQRVEGRIFKPMALTLSYAILVGTVLALVVVPCLASFFLKATGVKNKLGTQDEPPHENHAEPLLVALLRRGYEPLLDFILKRRWIVFVGSGIGLLVAAILGMNLGSEFLPKLEEGSLWVHAVFPESIAPSEAMKKTKVLRETFAQFPEVKTVVSQLGRPDDGTDIGGFNELEVMVDLNPPETWKTAHSREELSNAMNAALEKRLPGTDFTFSQVIEDNVNEAVSGIKGELGIKIFGTDADKLQELGDHIERIVKAVPGATDVAAERLLGQPQVQVKLDRFAVSRYGLAISDAQALVETAFGGTVATQIVEGERQFDLNVKLNPLSIADLESVRSIPLFGTNNEMVTLGAIANVETDSGFGRIYREDNERRIAVKFSVRGRDLGSVVADAQRAVQKNVKLPTGYRLIWTGSFENQQRAIARLMIIVPITLVLIFFILFTAFHSAKLATIILLNVPLAAIGGIAGLFFTSLPLSVSALMGFVALFGASVQNGVILLERIRELIDEGMSVLDSVREGALSRLRAVVMTSGMAALGLLPAALSHAVGAETARPFAVVIVGGLVSATVLTLIVLPVVSVVFLGRSVSSAEESSAVESSPPSPAQSA